MRVKKIRNKYVDLDNVLAISDVRTLYVCTELGTTIGFDVTMMFRDNPISFTEQIEMCKLSEAERADMEFGQGYGIKCDDEKYYENCFRIPDGVKTLQQVKMEQDVAELVEEWSLKHRTAADIVGNI